MTADLITPDELRRITEDKEMEKAREALEKNRKVEDDRDHLRDAFMAGDSPGRVRARVAGGQEAAERGEREVLAIRFSERVLHRRAINNFEANWPETLTGFAKRASRVLRRSSSRGVQAARPDHGFSRRHAGRRRDLLEMVTRRRQSDGFRGDIEPHGLMSEGAVCCGAARVICQPRQKLSNFCTNRPIGAATSGKHCHGEEFKGRGKRQGTASDANAAPGREAVTSARGRRPRQWLEHGTGCLRACISLYVEHAL